MGTNRIRSTENGHLLMDNWSGVRGSSGTSVNYFHPGKQKWKQTWVDNKGGVIEYEGEFRDGKMQFAGTLFSNDGSEMQSRMTFTPQEDGSVEQFIESSSDGGENWKTYFKGTYRREGSSSTAGATDA